MKQLIWKRGLPTTPGWYWQRKPGAFSGVDTMIVHVRDYAGELAIGNTTLVGWCQAEQAEWAGPIPEPEEETEHVYGATRKIAPHPFVATPDNGPCSSCGRSRAHTVHKAPQGESW